MSQNRTKTPRRRPAMAKDTNTPGGTFPFVRLRAPIDGDEEKNPSLNRRVTRSMSTKKIDRTIETGNEMRSTETPRNDGISRKRKKRKRKKKSKSNRPKKRRKKMYPKRIHETIDGTLSEKKRFLEYCGIQKEKLLGKFSSKNHTEEEQTFVSGVLKNWEENMSVFATEAFGIQPPKLVDSNEKSLYLANEVKYRKLLPKLKEEEQQLNEVDAILKETEFKYPELKIHDFEDLKNETERSLVEENNQRKDKMLNVVSLMKGVKNKQEMMLGSIENLQFQVSSLVDLAEKEHRRLNEKVLGVVRINREAIEADPKNLIDNL